MAVVTSFNRLPRWVTLLMVGIATAIILAMFNPWLIFAANTPTGGDMGAHVMAPIFLRDKLLAHGQLLGWSNDWYAGFPLYYFYFPLPSLFILLLDLVFPYGVAFKMVVVAGVVAMPFAAYYLARSMRFSRVVAGVVGAGIAVFAFMESYSIYGGNIASTLAGEFSFSWSMTLSLVYIGTLTRAVLDDRKYTKWASVALGAMALCHVLTTLVAVFASLAFFGSRKGRATVLTTWVWGFAIAGFWALPLLARIGFTSDMAWTPLHELKELFPTELWMLLPLAIAGGIMAVRRTFRAVPLLFAGLLPFIYFFIPNSASALFPSVFPDARMKLWNGRLLPYWYLAIIFFASLFVGLAVAALIRRIPAKLGWSAAIGAGAVLALGALAGVSFVGGWSRWNFTGYEGKEKWPEYEALMQTVDGLPPGRIQWEANNDALGGYGTPMSLMLFPYWSAGHPSMEGLFFESSITTPFHFLNAAETSWKPSNPIPGLNYHTFDLDRALPHLEQYGVQYYAAVTTEAIAAADEQPELTRVATTGPFVIYRLPEAQLVEVASYQPSVYVQPGRISSLVSSEDRTKPTFNEMALEWYDNPDLLDRWIVAAGPENWDRIERLSDLGAQKIPSSGQVSNVVIEDERISFHTTAVGVPHLVKVSYFPNWTAEGADGPWRSSPSLMVVVPTQEDVTLEFKSTWAELGGMALSAIGLVVLGVAAFRRKAVPA